MQQFDDSRGTRVVAADDAGIAYAAGELREGRLVAFPTETVYGLGANATDDPAVSAVFAAKARPYFNPLIVHVLNLAQAAEFVELNPAAEALGHRFWPGGLSMVLPRRAACRLSLLVSAGIDSVAIRSPAHPVARALIERAGVPVAAPSANRAGRISPTTAAACCEELAGRIPTILDGGHSALGIESTIVGFEQGSAILLRSGAIPREEIESVIGKTDQPRERGISAPGMMPSHYAPRVMLRLNAAQVRHGEALLAFGAHPLPGSQHVCNLSPTGNLHEAAANLFAMLRALDASGAAVIAVMPIPNAGLGEAINDRLSRAAAPRDPR